ncbi:prolyl oligopeptidase family serine peptidase [Christiangramia sp. SM2212]|uniref:prolyl oligopeptidase n=1 Tax=Christiangramia sediminicola TaxID=3073267 RepID=A0ABU1ET25_9FLAO|nr:prolyl oligopeptidase family serine peptidase [Christiangramia sp. SM2212]MDR5591552.1 prolyl oligopeptidase family serine peptidase [Christiangramia sp. SM2212]
MKYFTTLILVFTSISIFSQKVYDYPEAPKDSTTNVYFDEVIADPYQWMEDPNNPELDEWLDEQVSITKKLSSRQTNFWSLRKQVAAMFRIQRENTRDYVEVESKKDKFDTKHEWNPYTSSSDFFYKLEEQNNWKKLIKGNELIKKKGDHVLYRHSSINEKENLMALAVSLNGSDWATGYIFDLTTGQKFPYTIENIRTGSNFEWNGRDLYYTSYNKPKEGRELLDKATGQKLNKLSLSKTDVQPELVYKNPDTTGINGFSFDILNEKLRLYHPVNSRGKWYRSISIADLTQENFFPRRFIVYPADDKQELRIVHTKNDSIFLRTNIGAPNGKVLLANINTPNKLSELIPEYDLDLQYVNKLGKGKLACIYRKDGQNFALIFDMKGELIRKIDFPKGKRLNDFYELSDEAEYTNFSINSFYHPKTWYQLNLKTLEFKPAESVIVPFGVENLETRFVTYTSKDGIEVDMYITCDKNTVLDGTNPVLMYGYGGYGTTVEPFFEKTTGLLLAHGGILAVPNVRGGGGKGDDWALAGRKLNKQKAIDDFIAAGEYLIDNKYTNPDKLVINGGSHGALLVESSAIQRPELFKAVIAEAGPYDMLRFSKFTVGGLSGNLKEFGNPDNIEDYKNLKSYSPLHNIEDGKLYPNTLLITGDTDDRVPPLHTYKFLAKLQEEADPKGLYHMYITPGSGHGGALSQEDWEAKTLYEYYFMFEQLGIKI